MQKASIKLILRAFNGECDAFIAKSNYKNVQLMMKRIEASYEAICKISEKSNLVTINERYKDLKKLSWATSMNIKSGSRGKKRNKLELESKYVKKSEQRKNLKRQSGKPKKRRREMQMP